MSSANKAKGTRWETDLENYFNDNGLRARRLPRAGVNDIGDVAIELPHNIVIVAEAKNVKKLEMAEFLRQASIEADNYTGKYKDTATVGVVITKTRQRGTGEGRVTLTVDDFIELVSLMRCG